MRAPFGWMFPLGIVVLFMVLSNAGAPLLAPFSWMVHPLAGISLAFFASVIFSRQGREWQRVALAVGLLVLLALLGAGWVVHPGAGMLLGFFGARAFHRSRENAPALLAGLVGAALFMALGAGWLMFPLFVMGMIWLFTTGFGGKPKPAARLDAPPSPSALPEQAGGLPIGTFGGRMGEREAVPVGERAAQPQRQARSAPAPDEGALAVFLRDDRLPGEARAQLAALDLRTREALTHLQAQGQEGSEAAYLARAVRNEYAPSAVQAYLKLPRTLADTQPLQGDKTGRDLLGEQLNILLDAVQDILGSALKSGGQELLTHQRFLEEKFRKPRGDLDVTRKITCPRC